MLEVEFALATGISILFGPSGSGKTSCLRAIAGLITPDEGRIVAGNQVWFDSDKGINLAVQKRRIGFVFQDYALFPHLTAEQNIAFGIRAELKKAAKRERAQALLSSLGIGYVARQYPRELSGGESQRVALARALASDPALMLLDEPLSAVDLKTRALLLEEIGTIQRQSGIPFIYVTHHVQEAIAIGSEVIVLEQGRVQRQGRPQQMLAD